MTISLHFLGRIILPHKNRNNNLNRYICMKNEMFIVLNYYEGTCVN